MIIYDYTCIMQSASYDNMIIYDPIFTSYDLYIYDYICIIMHPSRNIQKNPVKYPDIYIYIYI